MKVINRLLFFLIPCTALLLTSCKSKQILAEGEVKSNLSAKTIINNHYKNQLDFKTIRGRLKIDYENGKNSEGFTLSLRMEKDKAIWLSATLSMVKVLITPNRVSFYNKLDNTYFDGDFSYLSKFLGTQLDFDKVQNLLIGQAMFDLKEDTYFASISNNNYQLKPKKDLQLFKKLFLIEPGNFKMSLQQLSQPENGRLLNINYKSYQKVEQKTFPDELVIEAEEGNNKTLIAIAYKSIEFNQKVTFPYSIPDGYKEISLK
ncbi:DUF4292 domain-containing protein [Abyssalbus ytuae]|uniref:DUF4292 domain-containing protein n=1 Tax=Abyssalbus ytuae TaxID=2926907 RepID=A0A9E6ZIA3_9FLAO|nr:DUF4292 domain-containing protein [Abyssalbus ytuae]UOB16022.1 DUF4292 domain-containing protein [Abyssalbus ytuae]